MRTKLIKIHTMNLTVQFDTSVAISLGYCLANYIQDPSDTNLAYTG